MSPYFSASVCRYVCISLTVYAGVSLYLMVLFLASGHVKIPIGTFSTATFMVGGRYVSLSLC